MEQAEKKECLVCGKLFKPCATCKAHSLEFGNEQYQWRLVTCCREHFYYHIPIISYYNGTMPIEEANTLLKEAIATYGEIEFKENIRPIVKEILAYEDKTQKETTVGITKQAPIIKKGK